jgi:hypothetical protein
MGASTTHCKELNIFSALLLSQSFHYFNIALESTEGFISNEANDLEQSPMSLISRFFVKFFNNHQDNKYLIDNAM